MTSLDRRKKQVVLGSGRKVKYDYLVIATGTLGAFPGQLPDVTSAQGTAMYRDFCFSLRKSHRVLIIGGNRDAIGLAGEVKTDYPDKQVIIHHVGKQLLFNDAPASVQSALQHILYRKDIEVYLNSKVIDQQSIKFNQHEKDQVVKSDSGKEFEVDLVVECPDRRKNSDLFKPVLGGSIDGAGSIKVDSNLKVEGCDDIYAIGDVNNTSECTLESEMKQAEYLAAHLKAVITNAETTVYARDEPSILIPIGRYSGCGLRHGKDLDEDDVMELISTNLMTKQVWEGLGLTCPLSTFT